MAEALAQLRGLRHRGRAVHVDRMAAPGPRGERDFELARVFTDLGEIRTLGRRRPIGVADVGTGSRIEQSGAVAHRARYRMADARAAPAFAHVRPERRARACRLEAEQPAAGSGNPDRA